MNNQTVRIVGGSFRGRNLKFTGGDRLRPTGNRIRETLFNWLMHDIHGTRCLDAFAGSGALGVEALSRGASEVVFIEQDRKVCAQLQKSLEELKVTEQVQLKSSNTLKYLDRPADQPFDVVFLDPPFGRGWIIQCLDYLRVQGWLQAESLVYVEYEREAGLKLQIEANFNFVKYKETTQVCFGLITPSIGS